MFCYKCGTENKENAKFCASCGTSLQISQEKPATQASVRDNVLVQEGRGLLKKAFSKNPSDAVLAATENKSAIWIVFLGANVLLFALASCLNISQVINHIISSLFDVINALVGSWAGSMFSNMALGGASSGLTVPPLFSVFFAFVFVAILMFAVEIGGIYLALKISKKARKPFVNIANTIGVASLPITLGLILNLLFGLIFPPLTLFIFVVALFVHMVMIYEGLRTFADYKTPPIIGIGIIALLLCIVAMIIFEIALQQGFSTVMNSIMDSATKALGNALSDGLGNLFGF